MPKAGRDGENFFPGFTRGLFKPIKNSIIKRLTTLLTDEQYEWLMVACCTAIFIGFVCSRALVSIGMISLLVAAVIFKGPLLTVKQYFKTKELLVLSLYLLIVLVSGVYSANTHDWLNWVRIKLPFVALPLAFAPVARLSNKKFAMVLYGYLCTFFVCTILVLGNYLLHYQSMTTSFRWGTQIPMPYSHIRYTLMVAFSFFIAVYMVKEKLWLTDEKEKPWLMAYAVFAFAALHILSVRSGLTALYLGLLCLAVVEIFSRKKYALGGLMIACIVILPFAAYNLVPSFHNKIEYMRYDLGQYNQGKINDRSDAMRLLSMQIGWQIWREHPAIGVGAGDLEDETNRIYETQYPDITPVNRRVPHNQFIWVLASTGIVGFGLFMLAFIYPLAAHRYYRYSIFFILHLAVFSSFFTEDTFEEQMGSGFYLIFLLLLMNHFKRE